MGRTTGTFQDLAPSQSTGARRDGVIPTGPIFLKPALLRAQSEMSGPRPWESLSSLLARAINTITERTTAELWEPLRHISHLGLPL
jgi:hypothetical protein